MYPQNYYRFIPCHLAMPLSTIPLLPKNIRSTSQLEMPTSTGFYYTVQQGDTIYLIAQRYNVPMNDIITANNILAPFVIYPGQRLFIPGVSPPTPPPGGRVYIVLPGDTLFFIAQKFNTSIEAIAQLNKIDNPDLIYPGQRLLIPPANATTSSSNTKLNKNNQGQ